MHTGHAILLANHHKKTKELNKMKTKKITFLPLALVAILVASFAVQAINFSQVGAAQITARSLTLQAGATDGGSMPEGEVNHLFEFTMPAHNPDLLGSIKFEYCTTAADTGALTCITPTDLVTTSATLGTVSGVATGFTLNNGTNGAPYIAKASAATAAAGAQTVQLLGVINPSAVNETFFVRMTTYASLNATGPVLHSGTVAASTARPIIVSGTMPESLVFCTGETITLTSGVPDCSTAVDGTILFDRLFSPVDTATARSQMSASTNAEDGYVITANGATLTSGSNTITAMPSTAAPALGNSQFGLNLKENTLTDVNLDPLGLEVSLASNGTNYRGQAATGYDTIDQFRFVTGDPIANSGNGGGGPGASDAQIFTISYIVNVPGSQAAGTYSTTMTYICTPEF